MTKDPKPRNPYAVPARRRKAGSHSTQEKGGDRNKQQEYLEEYEEEKPDE